MARHARRLILWTTGALLSLAVLAMLGIAVLVWGIDPDVFRGRVERAATDALGRRVELTGALRWRPGLHLSIESLGGRIANAEGFGSTPLASWQALRLGVALRPLLQRRVEIDHIEITGLRLNLQRNARGNNWSLKPAATSQPPSEGFLLAIGSVSLRDGAVAFADAAGASAWSITALSADARLPASLDAPLLQFSDLSLQARVAGAHLASTGIALEVKVPRLDFDRQQGAIAMPAWQLKWNDASLHGAIEMRLGDAPGAEGSLRMQAPSLRGLLQSVTVAAPSTRDASALGPVELSARFVADTKSAALTQLVAKLDSTRVEGEVRVPAFSPLSMRFDLSADQVQMDRYLTPEDEPGTPLRLPLAELKALDAKGILRIRRASLAGAAAREIRIDVD